GARDVLLERVGHGDAWCLSHQVWAGQPVPVARCSDCGQLAVAVDPGLSCGKCMGELVAEDDVLDARFVGALWPLAAAGWPDDEAAPAALAPCTTLVVDDDGLERCALPMAALALRLAVSIPFGSVAVLPLAAADTAAEAPDVEQVVGTEGTATVRVALVAEPGPEGDLDLDRARALAPALGRPARRPADARPLRD